MPWGGGEMEPVFDFQESAVLSAMAFAEVVR
jgi:hypothetical protein